MIYLSSFLFSDEKVIDPNIYPYNVFADKAERLLLFAPITVLYGENASGKSTMLNIMANKLRLEGLEYATSNQYGRVPYFLNFIKGCSYALGEEENGKALRRIPQGSRYIKSEDILYEIKKIQQEQILEDGYVYEHVRRGLAKEQREEFRNSYATEQKLEILKYAQEKYSNGETTMQLLLDAGRLYGAGCPVSAGRAGGVAVSGEPDEAGGEAEPDGQVPGLPIHHIDPFAFHAGDAAGKDL